MFSVGTRVKYRNFGFLPTGRPLWDAYCKLFGYPQLMKRLQTRDILRALDLGRHDTVLDFGCGSGYFTVELAKICRRAVGIDAVAYARSAPSLRGRLHFIRARGEALPFAADTFDAILASEVLALVEDPGWFVRQWKRVLKPGGKLVVSNGAGKMAIKRAYADGSWPLRVARRLYRDRVPASYEEYERILNEKFGNRHGAFYGPQEIETLLAAHGFDQISLAYTPGRWPAAYSDWSQFLAYLRSGRVLGQRFFPLKFAIFSLLRPFERAANEGGVLYVAANRK